MERLKAYILRNFEHFFVLVVLVTILVINYFLPHKLAFLNFYYLPILGAGYILAATGRKAVPLPAGSIPRSVSRLW